MPTRGGAGKSRLRVPGATHGAEHATLARAIARDTVAAALSAQLVDSVTVVTDDAALAAALADRCLLVADPGTGLAGAIAAGLAAVASQEVGPAASAGGRPGAGAGTSGAAARTGGVVAVLLGDVPAMRPDDLDAALAAGLQHAATAPHPAPADPQHASAGAETTSGGDGTTYLPDADGTGTVLLMGPAEALRPVFGPGSAAAHGRTATRLPLALPRLRRDVDDAADLAAAARLGLGPYTSAALPPGYRVRMQASVHTDDAAAGVARLVTDDGVLLDLPAAVLAAAGLRRLRIGQRLAVELTGTGEVAAVAIPGLTPSAG